MVWKLEHKNWKRRVYGGKCTGGGIMRDFLAKLHSIYLRAVLESFLLSRQHLSCIQLAFLALFGLQLLRHETLYGSTTRMEESRVLRRILAAAQTMKNKSCIQQDSGACHQNFRPDANLLLTKSSHFCEGVSAALERVPNIHK